MRRTDEPPTARTGSDGDADVWERWHRGWHYAFYALLAVCAALALADPSVSWGRRAAIVGLSALLGGWYWWAVIARGWWIRERPLVGLGYFAVTGALFLGLAVLHPAYMFLAFAVYWQVFSFWPGSWAIPGAMVLSGALWWRSVAAIDAPPPAGATVLFPLIAVAVATLLSLFIGSIIRQSEERKRLIGQLEATRRELARRSAGRGRSTSGRGWRGRSTTPSRRAS